jgi:hypothetical protein
VIAEEGLNHGLKVKTNVGKYIKISRPAALQKQHTNTSRGAVLGGKNIDLIVLVGPFFSRRHDTPLTEWHIQDIVYIPSPSIMGF